MTFFSVGGLRGPLFSSTISTIVATSGTLSGTLGGAVFLEKVWTVRRLSVRDDERGGAPPTQNLVVTRKGEVGPEGSTVRDTRV